MPAQTRAFSDFVRRRVRQPEPTIAVVLAVLLSIWLATANIHPLPPAPPAATDPTVASTSP